MNIVVIGLGSMGKRRIRLMKEMYPHFHIVGVDGRKDRCDEVQKMFSIKCFNSLSEVDLLIDAAFICTSPNSHNELIQRCLSRGWNIFSELNLVSDGYDDNIRLAKEKGVVLFLSSTFLYREEINYIRNRIGNASWNYIYHIGQYLPDWHPWENYKETFFGNKETNGCREIMAIELPWLIETFGEVNEINVIGNKITELNIDFNDNFFVQLIHANGSKGCLIADVVSPVAVRKLEVYKEGKYLSWNGTPESLMEFNTNNKKLEQVRLFEKTEHADGYSSFVVENAYKNEIKAFFATMTNNETPIYGFEQDKKILQLINRLGA